jgi:hypothetical protein
MNLRETQQLLTMIWSMYPNAPRLSREDKEVMAMAWLGLMYEYSLEDVWKAARQCFEAEPRFIPTAPEVMRRCTKSYKVERYLPPEYAALTTGIDLTFNACRQRDNLERALRMRAQERELDGGEKTMLAEIETEQARIREIDRIWGEAYQTARIAYEQAERAKLADDGAEKRLKALAII